MRVLRGEVDVILCLCINRLSSNENHVAILDYEWERLGVRMAFAEEDYERSPLGRMIRSLKVFSAAVDKEKIKGRTQPARRLRAESGKPLGCGPLKFGLVPRDIKRTAFDEDPATGQAVRDIFALADQGVSIRQIGVTLERRGITPPQYAKTGSLRGARIGMIST
jgi:DNA invertase Pin-like site-specific DNA recombinase